MKFIHMTDTHLVEPGQLLYAVDPIERLSAAVHSVCREHPDAAFVAITGDLVHTGQEMQYRALKSVLEPLPMPVHLVPGNHDERTAMRRAFTNLTATEEGYVQYAVDIESVSHVCPAPIIKWISISAFQPESPLPAAMSRRHMQLLPPTHDRHWCTFINISTKAPDFVSEISKPPLPHHCSI